MIMTKERLAEIKRTWIGDGSGLAITGNASYKMIAELIAEAERAQEIIKCFPPVQETSISNVR